MTYILNNVIIFLSDKLYDRSVFDEVGRKMKRKKIILISFSAIIIAAAIILGIWYFVPKTFLNRSDSSEVISIYVFDGNTGKEFIINDTNEIKQITDNLQNAEMKRDNISIGNSGYGFKMRFMGKNEKVIDSFIINSPDTIRDDPFFYRCDGSLCFDYLKELEDMYAK